MAADRARSTSAARCPRGVTVLEASAGTGKTFTIAALTARYVAEGTPLDQLLLVTFTRMATGELRDRVRERLVSAEQGLGGRWRRAGETTTRSSGCSPTGRDEEVRDAPRAPGPGARRTSTRATIATTHGFCQEVLGGLGVAGDVEPDTDVRRGPRPSCSRRSSTTSTSGASTPRDPPDIDSRAGAADRADGGRQPGRARSSPRRRRRKRRRDALAPGQGRARGVRAAQAPDGVMTYDDLLTRLDDALGGPGGGAVAARLRERYRVVLVDEFQDTDPRAVGDHAPRVRPARRTLVLIGDPKQAIYAFRGADVYAYLEAAGRAGTQATLEVNWRSDQALVDAYDALLRRRAARPRGDRLPPGPGRRRQPRAAARRRSGQRAAARPGGAPRRRPASARPRAAFARKRAAREHVAKDLAARPRRAAVVGRADRAAHGGGASAGPSACAPATSPCSCARTATRRSCARRWTGPGSRP